MIKGKEILDKAKKEILSFDADKGYDSEENHEKVVEELHAEDRIKLRNKDVPAWRTKGEYRKKAKRRINRLKANYRSINETIFSVIKRINGSTIRSLNSGMQNREILFKEIAYNATRILNYIRGFLQSHAPAKFLYSSFLNMLYLYLGHHSMCHIESPTEWLFRVYLNSIFSSLERKAHAIKML